MIHVPAVILAYNFNSSESKYTSDTRLADGANGMFSTPIYHFLLMDTILSKFTVVHIY
jgi:hypothetical protein